eukprot:Lithocolla_globosa_v1_NODE_513_length_3859_cov_6.191115.p4 type:complete len:116 gc:universal NODE_513_length_3859_cov_6.191115:2000-1653(-)
MSGIDSMRLDMKRKWKIFSKHLARELKRVIPRRSFSLFAAPSFFTWAEIRVWTRVCANDVFLLVMRLLNEVKRTTNISSGRRRSSSTGIWSNPVAFPLFSFLIDSFSSVRVICRS